jgi:hypothetical protein
VPHPGQYVFVVHYYQPDHPGEQADEHMLWACSIWEDIISLYTQHITLSFLV